MLSLYVVGYMRFVIRLGKNAMNESHFTILIEDIRKNIKFITSIKQETSRFMR